MNLINIYLSPLRNPLEQSVFSEYFALLSPELKEKNSQYVRWQNRHAHLFGKLLLIEGLKKHGVEKDIWNYVEYNSHCRPYLTLDGYDFNISHSGNYVVCAIGKDIKLGIDIEEKRNRDLKNFQMTMTPSQWDEIHGANDPLKEFYKYWTMKESAIKADGRGCTIPLDQLEVVKNTLRYENASWFVRELEIHGDYSAALATDQLSEFKIQQIDFYGPKVFFDELKDSQT